jgi:hypothetical protein
MSPLSLFARHPRADLSAFIDGQLSQERHAAVQTHLARCAACQAEVDDLIETRAALSALPQTPAPRSFALTPDQIAAPVKRRPHRAENAPAFFGMRIASAGIAVALALVFVADLGDGGSGGNNESARSAGEDAALQMTSIAEDSAGDGAFSQGGDDSADSGEAPTKTEETGFLRPGSTPPDAPADAPSPEAVGGGVGGTSGGSGGVGSAPTPTAVDGGPASLDADLTSSTPNEIAAVVPTETLNAQYAPTSGDDTTADRVETDAITSDNDDGLSTLQIAEIVLAVALAVAVAGGFLVPFALRRIR